MCGSHENGFRLRPFYFFVTGYNQAVISTQLYGPHVNSLEPQPAPRLKTLFTILEKRRLKEWAREQVSFGSYDW